MARGRWSAGLAVRLAEDRPRAVDDEHRRLLAAIGAGDATTAGQVARRHVLTTRERT